MDIKGTVALITGGASGLGAATAGRLFDAGASVVLVDLPGSAGQGFAAELNARGNVQSGAPAAGTPMEPARKAVFVPADVTSEAEVQAAVDAAVALGPLRIVVNCAGIATPARSWAATACCRWRPSTASSRSTSWEPSTSSALQRPRWQPPSLP